MEPQTDEKPVSLSVISTHGIGENGSSILISSSAEVGGTAKRSITSSALGAFFGLGITKVAYISSNRTTHSDVMSTVTSLVLPVSTEDDFLFAAQDNNNNKKKHCKGRRSMGNLSVPTTKLNRELALERKIFLERLHRERVFRAQVEEGAATMIQAMVRGQLHHFKLNNNNGSDHDNEERNVECDEDSPSMRTSFQNGRKRQRMSDQTKTLLINYEEEKETDVYFARLKDESKIRKYLTQMRRQTDKMMGDHAEFGGIDKNLQEVMDKYNLFASSSGGSGGSRKGRYHVYNSNNKKKLNRMAIRLQCCARRFIARRFMCVALQYRTEEMQREAAIAIQKRFRSHRHSEFIKNRELNAMTKAAIMIQASTRRLLDRRFVTFVKIHFARAATEKNGAVKLQKFLRHKVAQQRVMQARMDRASVKVQTGFRSHQTRRSVEEHKRQRSVTALKLQALQRGRIGRRAAAQQRAEHIEKCEQAAIKVQMVVRVNSAKKMVQNVRENNAALAIQSRTRQRKAKYVVANRVREREKHRAATTIQCRARIHVARRKLNDRQKIKQQESAATNIQSMYRGKRAVVERHMRQHAKENRAATTLQTTQRKRKAKKVVQVKRERFAASTIQRSFRSNSAKNLLQEQREALNERLRNEAEKTLSEMMPEQKVRRASRSSSTSSSFKG